MMNFKRWGMGIGCLIGLSAGGASVFASTLMIGQNIRFANERNNPSVCEIQISNYDNRGHDGECSGTLVSATQVYTAGHCFGRNFNLNRHTVSVSCGGRSMGHASAVLSPDSSDDSLWDHEGSGMEIPVTRADFAVITLPRAVTQTTSPVAIGPESYFDATGALLPNVQCKMLGYGGNDINAPEIDEDGVPNIGSLVEASLQSDVLTYDTGQGVMKLTPRDSAYLVTSCGGGDSGGPLFCQAPGGVFTLVATIVSRQHAESLEDHNFVTNLLHPVWVR